MSISSSQCGIDVLAKKVKKQENSKKKVIVISGPTGVGKTALSLVIAKALGGEIVSADSMQVYRGMDIGTAKPTAAERREVVHHLIDSRDLDETCNVMQYYQEATLAIREILDKGAVPIVVGGTGFYLHALLYGPPNGPASDPQVRERLEQEMDLRGVEPMYHQLMRLDPEYCLSITPNDRHKIIRALEIIELSSRSVSSFRSHPTPLSDYQFRCWFLHLSRELLYPLIEKRCDAMIEAGFVQEVEALDQQGLRRNTSASQAIGYRQCLEYLDSPRTAQDWHKFILSFKQASRQYAKRQFTWFRKEELFRWLDRGVLSVEQISEIIIQDYEGGLKSSFTF